MFGMILSGFWAKMETSRQKWKHWPEMLKQEKCQIFLIPRSVNLCKWTDSKNLEHLEIPRIQNMKDAAFCENC